MRSNQNSKHRELNERTHVMCDDVTQPNELNYTWWVEIIGYFLAGR